MSATQPTANRGTADAAPATPASGTAPGTATPPSISTLEAEIAARRDRLATTIDELTHRVNPRTIIQRQTEAAKSRFADVATTPEGDLRVERLAAVVAVVAVVGGLILYRRLRSS